jgi:hypothetical protein
MAVYDYSDLLDRIDAVVYDNTTKDVTAERLKQLLIDILDSYPYMIKYDSGRTYDVGAFCVYDSGGGYKGYICIAQTTGAFAGADWSQLGV